MSVFSQAIESILKNASKKPSKQALESGTTQGVKHTNTPEQKQIHKEQRGLYNVTYNDKIATYIQTDLESIDNAIRYARGNKNKGATHIKIRHQNNQKQEGYITQDELLKLGNNIRDFLGKHKKPFIDERGARLYEWQNEKGDKFRVVVDSVKQTDGSRTTPQLPRPPAEEIITFYSNRNLPKDKIFEFKNPKLQESPLQNQQNALDSSLESSFNRE